MNAAFARYSRELLGGLGELEAEYGASGQLTGLRLSVQPEGRTRSLNLLSAGERTMAGLGFLFARSQARPGGAQFLLVTRQKATMEVAQVIWGVTTDRSGASSILSIRQGEHG